MIDEGHALVRGCLALNRPGPYQLQAAIGAVHTDSLDATMTGYHAWHVTRAELLRRLRRDSEARSAYDSALGLTGNDAEQSLLFRRRDELRG